MKMHHFIRRNSWEYDHVHPITFESFLCGTPARDYIFQKTPYEEQIREAASLIKEADYVLLELGVGFNTPTIIRFPFEKLLKENPQVSLVRLNLNEAIVPESSGKRAVGINEDMKKSIEDLALELAK